MALFFLGIAFTAAIAALAIHPDHAGARSEYALWLMAFVSTVIAGGIGARDWREKKRIVEVGDQLATYVQFGQAIIASCYASEARRLPAPNDWADAWGKTVFDYIQRSLGGPYAVRFDNSAGLPTGTTTLEPPYSRVEGYLRARIARLTQFMQELVPNQR